LTDILYYVRFLTVYSYTPYSPKF